MKKKKSILVGGILLCLAIALCGCGKKAKENKGYEIKKDQEVEADITQEIQDKEEIFEESVEENLEEQDLTVINVSINPKATLYVNSQNSVVKYTFDNEDANTYYRGINLLSMDYLFAIDRMVHACVDAGLISDSNTDVHVTFEHVAKDANRQEMVNASVAVVNTALSDSNVNQGECVVSDIEENYTSHVDTATWVEQESVNGEIENRYVPVDTVCTDCNGTGKRACEWCKGATLVCFRCGGTAIHRSGCQTCGGAGTIFCHKCDGQGGGECGLCRGSGTDICHRCDGKGLTDTEDIPYACTICNGTGIRFVTPGDGSGPGYYDTCDLCHGSGQMVHKAENRTCEDCNGSGKITCDDCNGAGVRSCEECNNTGVEVCPECGGTDDPCAQCLGTGMMSAVCPECDHSGYNVCDVCIGSGRVTR